MKKIALFLMMSAIGSANVSFAMNVVCTTNQQQDAAVSTYSHKNFRTAEAPSYSCYVRLNEGTYSWSTNFAVDRAKPNYLGLPFNKGGVPAGVLINDPLVAKSLKNMCKPGECTNINAFVVGATKAGQRSVSTMGNLVKIDATTGSLADQIKTRLGSNLAQ